MAVHTTTDDPDVIERDLQETRSRLDTRLSELGKRLSPGQIVDEGLDLLRTREGVDFTRNLGVAVRERPIPVALVGIGLAWLMSGARDPAAYRESHLRTTRLRSPQDDLMTRAWTAGQSVVRQTGESDVDYRSRVTDARGKVLGVARSAQETAESYAERVQEALFAARDRISGAVSGASERISSMGASLGDAMQSASDRVTGTAHDLRDQASSLGNRMGDQASSLGSQIGDQGRRLSDAASYSMRQARRSAGGAGSGMLAALSDNPVLLGAVGMAVGAVLGALLPPTEIEREYLGDAAHDARTAVQGVVQEAVNRGSEVVQAAMDAGRQTVQEAVQHASELGGAAKDAASDLAGQAQRHAGEMGDAARGAARDVAANATANTAASSPASSPGQPRART